MTDDEKRIANLLDRSKYEMEVKGTRLLKLIWECLCHFAKGTPLVVMVSGKVFADEIRAGTHKETLDGPIVRYVFSSGDETDAHPTTAQGDER